MVRFMVTIFLGAFLLFQVQPLIAKYILPWFGGGPAVWTTCMLFFQGGLLAGYAYAHLLNSRLSHRRQPWFHLAFVAGSLLLLPIVPEAELWKPKPGDEPTAQILLLLLATVGAPYVLLASTSPLLQRWFDVTFPGRSPYRLYALSNAGSLLALLSYPFLFEPTLTLGSQVTLWSVSYGLFAAFSGWSAWQFATSGRLQGQTQVEASNTPSSPGRHPTQDSERRDRESASPPSLGVVLLWVGLAACGSALLLAATNQMCQEIAVVPFLWVLPLSIYLATFIICFESEWWYDRRWFALLLGVMAPAACAAVAAALAIDIWIQIVIHSLALFAGCMVCHGELTKAKPAPRHLTLFYLMVALGGALGGVLVAIVAPRVFVGYWELQLSFLGIGVLAVISWYRDQAWLPYANRPHWIIAPLSAAFLTIIVALSSLAVSQRGDALVVTRNFYGILRLTETSQEDAAQRILTHGRVKHGSQFIDEEKRSWPTAYYGPSSGIGLAIKHHPRREASNPADRGLRVGVVGLGAGTISTYGRPQDYFRYYEINPDVVRVANRYFTYNRDSEAEIDVIVGDGRIELERELADGDGQQFDILAIDAFSSDAIPLHLLTTESARIYWKHLKPNGLLLFHISNHSVDLEPVVRGLAAHLGCEALLIVSDGNSSKGTSSASWMVLTKSQDFLENETIQRAAAQPSSGEEEMLVWTDDFASLWQVLKL